MSIFIDPHEATVNSHDCTTILCFNKNVYLCHYKLAARNRVHPKGAMTRDCAGAVLNWVVRKHPNKSNMTLVLLHTTFSASSLLLGYLKRTNISCDRSVNDHSFTVGYNDVRYCLTRASHIVRFFKR